MRDMTKRLAARAAALGAPSASLLMAAALGVAGCQCKPEAGTDAGTVCNPGELLCDGDVLQECDSTGFPLNVMDCGSGGQVCVEQRGCLACYPNALVCDGLDIYQCNPDGTSNDFQGTCDGEAGDTCDAGLCVNACDLAGLNRSNMGCTYWAVDLDNADVGFGLNAAAQQFAVVVSNPTPLLALVEVSVNDAPYGSPPSERVVEMATVPPQSLYVFELDPREVDGSPPFQFDSGTNSAITSNAYKITSTAPIVAYQFNPLDNANVFSNDASLLVPVEALDTRYRVMGWPQTIADVPGQPLLDMGQNLRATLSIVGAAPDTTVMVTLATDIVGDGGMITPGGPGDTLTFTVGPYDVVNLETGSFGADFTGSVVSSDKPVAVFSGSEAADVPTWATLQTRKCCADHLEEQLFPTSTLGLSFVGAKSPARTPMVDAAGGDVAIVPEPEYWVVLAVSEGTTVTTSLPPPQDQFVLFEGQSVVIEAFEDFTIEGTGPLIVGQFMASQETTGIPFDLPGGDPAMLLVPPVEQFRDRYLFLTPDKYAFDFIVITAPVGAVISLDGTSLYDAPWATRCSSASAGALIDNMTGMTTFYEAIRCQLSFPVIVAGSPPDNILPGEQNDGVHLLVSDVPVGLTVGAFDAFVSYTYAAGLDLAQINIQ
jgi:hypothetical protein